MLEEQDVQTLIHRLDDIYVRKEDCNLTVNTVNDRIDKFDVGFAKIDTKLAILCWVGGILCSLIVGYIGTGILERTFG